MLRSRRWLRHAAPLASICLIAACSENGRVPLLSEVEPIDIPAADTTTRTNVNISNPTLDVPTTYPVGDGDLLTLVWSDEFDGASLDPELWFFESGDGSQYGIPGWGNNELQWYLPDNARLENGTLIIEARRETVGDFGYTSARITTKDRFAVQYGRIEASIKLPAGQGLWPAFWMLPQDDAQGSPPADGVYGGFSASGEIDIMEAVNLGGAPGPAGFGGGNVIFGTIHFGGEFPANQFSTIEYTPSESTTDQFNTYAVEWDEFEIRWYFNGILFAVQNSWSSSAAPYPAPFDQPFKILLNLAVGGGFPGSPDGSTPFPSTMEVDWVRVYSGEEPFVQPADPGETPDDVIYATDPNEPVDLVFGVDYTGFDPFGSGSVFNSMFTSDPSFNPAFAVTTGNGYGAQVGQLGIFGFAAGFADAYDRLVFKAKNLNNDLIRVKFNPDGDYLDVDLTNSPYSTALGNGWYQVVIPIADFTGTATATTLLFETDNTAPSAFTFLLTDLGFSGTGGGGTFDSGLLTNGDFEAGPSPWLAGVTNPIDASNVIDDGTGNQVFFVDVMAPGNPFDVNLSQQLPITPDETYTLTFNARSNVNRTMLAGIGLSGGSFANTTQSVNLTTAWQTFTLELTAAGFGDATSRVLFDMGAEVGEVYIDDVNLVVSTAPPPPPPFDPGLLTNGDFEAGTSPWLAGVTNPIDASNVIDDGTGNQVFFVDVMAPGNPFDVNLSQQLSITPDETYTLTFMARSNVNRTIVAGIGLSGGSFANTVQTVNLTTAWQTFTLDLTATGFGDATSRVLFDMGAEVGEVYIDDVSLVVATGGGGSNLATNGNFETGDFSGWQQFVNSGVQSISNDTPPNGGSFSAAISGNTAPGAGGTTEIKQANLQAGTLQLGDVLTITFDVRGTFGPGGQLNVLSFTEFAGGGGTLSNQTVIAGGVDNWTTQSYQVTLSGPDASGGFSLAFNAVCGAVMDCVADVFIDNVSIELN